MGTVIGEVLPLALGILISPIPIIATTLMLLAPQARSASVGFMLGWLAGIVVALVVFVLLSGLIPEQNDDASRPVSGVVKIVLGVLIMRAKVFSVAGAVAICLVFGAFHGYAHGTEAGASGDYLRYIGGLVIATVLLHIAGMALGLMLRLSSRYGMRVAGALVAAAGVWFAAGLAG